MSPEGLNKMAFSDQTQMTWTWCQVSDHCPMEDRVHVELLFEIGWIKMTMSTNMTMTPLTQAPALSQKSPSFSHNFQFRSKRNAHTFTGPIVEFSLLRQVSFITPFLFRIPV